MPGHVLHLLSKTQLKNAINGGWNWWKVYCALEERPSRCLYPSHASYLTESYKLLIRWVQN
jgi:hypothetical protein